MRVLCIHPTTGRGGLIRYLTVKILTVGGEIDKALQTNVG